MASFEFQPKGVCTKKMSFNVVDGKLFNFYTKGGCSGNLQGIAALAEGMDIDILIGRLQGIKCGFKKTSCPDQLALALEEYKKVHGK
ncbi:MAG: TIGR03905 family TSCPD domain-containing protein [Firmicutes bacterium]|nr:TIGR03905 family TSCPD domain-containing protein [Bacillota bacterium]